MQVVDLVTELPDGIVSEIGRMVTMFAVIEYKLIHTIYPLLGVDPKMGRLAVREPRAAERLDLIRDLMKLRGFNTSDADIRALRKRIKDMEEERDHLAHAVWLKHPATGQYHTQMTRGVWEKLPKEEISRNKRVIPEMRDPPDFKALRREILEILDVIDRLGSVLHKLLSASHKKP